jgi:predicted AAA+ superfamily ATPase
MKRIYESLLDEHFVNYRQMAFLSGPRQVGKTTSARKIASSKTSFYFNWDFQQHRALIIKGPQAVAENAGVHYPATGGSAPLSLRPLIVFDEIHKYGKWKLFLKGFFDLYKDRYNVLVTGSGRLDVYKRGGDSLMGRYFLYRMHPLSVAEILRTSINEQEISLPEKIDADTFEGLLQFGGFPEPFLQANKRFYNRWKRLRIEQLLQEDLRDISRIQEIAQMEMLARILQHQAGQLISFASLASEINVSVDTVRRWLTILESLFYCFSIRPWFRNIPKSLRKQPKVYLWDWSDVQDVGARHENFIASHLLKAVHFWTDMGLGTYQLYYIRDKDKREVDFLVTRDDNPWFLVEVKTSKNVRLNKYLAAFKEKTKASHAFQIAFDLDYIEQDCFSLSEPVIVPATTFLSQLI